MNKILLLSFIGCLTSLHFVYGQQLPITQQNYLNTYSLQPAFSGHLEGLNVWGSYRKNMVGFSGSPNTVALNLSYRNNDKHGFGTALSTDQSGLFRNTNFNTSYAYRIKIKASNFLSAGISAGISENRFDFASVNVEDKTDIGVLSNNGKLIYQFGFGLAFTNKHLTIGIGMPIIYSSNVKYRYNSTDFNYKLNQTTTANISYSFVLGAAKKIEIIPSVISRIQQNTTLLNDYVTTLQFDKRFSLTTGYRSSGVIPIVLMAEIKKNFKVFYGQEIACGNVANPSKGGFEIGIGYKFPLRSGREHKIEDQRRDAERDSLSARLRQLNDTLRHKNYQLIELDNIKEDNNALVTEISKLKTQLEVTSEKQIRLEKEIEESKNIQKETFTQTKDLDDNKLPSKKDKILENEVGKVKEILKGKSSPTNSVKSIDTENVEIDQNAGYYVVVQASVNRVALEADLKIWNEKEANTFIIKPKKSKWYFIAIAQYEDLDSSMIGLKEIRKKYRKSWVKKQ
jgi:type IX secretion system PorP/SprF family membrane protein